MTDVPNGSHSGGAGRHVDCARPLANGHGVHLNGGVRHRRSDPCLQMRVVPKRGLASAAQGRSLGAELCIFASNLTARTKLVRRLSPAFRAHTTPPRPFI